MIRVAPDLPPHLSAAERAEGHEMLHEVPEHVGHIPTPVLDLLNALVDSDTTDAGRVLVWLRTVVA